MNMNVVVNNQVAGQKKVYQGSVDLSKSEYTLGADPLCSFML